ncbi:MAG TPA: ATP-binding protein [Candidatus Dormibacteraeota bacterium]|jgi:two-component system sensor histidine kinase KdpD|nr:ATP-binding protein [Candidatus Dormibacteraeota bacterium]
MAIRTTAQPRWLLLDSAAAVAGPAALTAILVHLDTGQRRDYVFLYLGIVAVLGVTRGLWPAVVAAALSFLLVDYYFVPPVHTLTINDEQDQVNLAVLLGVSGLVGGVGSWRRHTQLRAEALARQLDAANAELTRLNREQSEAAAVAVRLAKTQQQVSILEESDRLRRDFLGNVSHELRTPLSSILTGSTALLARPDLPKGLHDDLASIADEARRLNRLVGDMLDMAQIEGSGLELRLDNVTLVEAVEAAVDRLHLAAPSRRVDVKVDGSLAVLADWDRLGQILDNVLNNANRFSPPETPITVQATSGARSMIVIRVIDEGPGIPAELHDRVFERFVRGTSGGAERAGTGLGLAIVRGLVEGHAGRVWLDDADGHQGAAIAFSLPSASVT